MRRMAITSALALILCGFLSGCAGTTCDQAVTKLEGECALGTGVMVPLSNNTVECTDNKKAGIFSECASGCVLDNDCSDIVDKDQDNSYTKCLADCQK